MSKQNLEKELKKELTILNYVIDQKILKGRSYSKEARRHKIILASLNNLKALSNRSSWFGRSISSFSLI
jgi:hypothetical protein